MLLHKRTIFSYFVASVLALQSLLLMFSLPQAGAIPTPELAPSMISSISDDAGVFHNCAINSGQIYCWGANWGGQLGNNTTTNSSVPVLVDTSGVLAGKTITSVQVSEDHSCALADGQIYCWGDNYEGKLGNNTTTNSSVPVAIDPGNVLAGKTITSIALGVYYTCAVADGQAYCWGYNGEGQLGNNTTTDSLVPIAVDTSGVLAGKTITSMQGSEEHTCALADGQPYCWGANYAGQLGNNTTTDSLLPVAVDTSVLAGKTITSMRAGGWHTCVFTGSDPYCWGANWSGQLGNNTTTDSLVPIAVDTSGVLAGKIITSIQAGEHHTCVLADGQVYCWGRNNFGQLGNNTTDDSLVPVAVDTSGVLAGKIITKLAANSRFNCVLADGQAYCWGFNPYGGLGNNSTSTYPHAVSVPVAVDASIVNSYFTVPTASIAGDYLTDNDTIPSKPTFSGTGEPGYTVNVTVHSDPVSCSAVVNGSGAWACTLPSSLSAGNHIVNITATDSFGGIYTLAPTPVVVLASQTAGGSSSSPSSGGTMPSQTQTNSRYNSTTVIAAGDGDTQETPADDATTEERKIALNNQTDDNEDISDEANAVTDATPGEAQGWIKLAGISAGVLVLLGGLIFGIRRYANRG